MMDLAGASVMEVVCLLNTIAESEWQYHRPSDTYKACTVVAGISLHAKQVFRNSVLYAIHLCGEGWDVSFRVSRKCPANVPRKGIVQVDLTHAREPRKLSWYDETFIHSEELSGEDAFRYHMTILRMFSSEWM